MFPIFLTPKSPALYVEKYSLFWTQWYDAVESTIHLISWFAIWQQFSWLQSNHLLVTSRSGSSSISFVYLLLILVYSLFQEFTISFHVAYFTIVITFYLLSRLGSTSWFVLPRRSSTLIFSLVFLDKDMCHFPLDSSFNFPRIGYF